MAEQAKVPAIRFAGFTDPWEQRKFSNLTDRVSIHCPSDCVICLKSNTRTSFPARALNKDLRDKEGGTSTGIIIFDDFTTSSHIDDFALI